MNISKVPFVLMLTILVGLLTSSASAQSQPEMNQDAARIFEKADIKLNVIYKELLSGLDATGKKKLQASQKAWLTYRDAEAEFQSDLGGRGGSIAPLIYSTTETELTEERIKALHKQISLL